MVLRNHDVFVIYNNTNNRWSFICLFKMRFFSSRWNDPPEQWSFKCPSHSESSATGYNLLCLTRKKAERVGWQQPSGGIRATRREERSYDFNMADRGPFLTSCIIFYLSIGAAIFQILEEPNWKSARDRYMLQKENILKNYPCLTQKDLEEILEVWIRLFLIARQAEIMAEITCPFIL